MAHYGPPGGPYHGSSSDPWPRQDGESTGEYGQPADPWGGEEQAGSAERWGGSSPSVPPGAPGSGWAPAGWTPAEPEPMWAPLAPDANWSTSEPPKSKGGIGRVVVTVVATLVVLGLAGVGIGLYLSNRDEPTPSVLPTVGASGEVIVPDPPGASEPVPVTPAPTSSTDARFVKQGQCVTNEGSAQRPQLVITQCVARTYEVLARIDEPTTGDDDAKTKCADVKNYTNYYFFNSELDDLDFVLCLRER